MVEVYIEEVGHHCKAVFARLLLEKILKIGEAERGNAATQPYTIALLYRWVSVTHYAKTTFHWSISFSAGVQAVVLRRQF